MLMLWLNNQGLTTVHSKLGIRELVREHLILAIIITILIIIVMIWTVLTKPII